MARCRYCVNQRFGGMYRLHLRGRKQEETDRSVAPAHAGLLAIRSPETSVNTISTRRHIPYLLQEEKCSENFSVYMLCYSFHMGLIILGVPGGMCQTSGGCSLC
jgi:hypothetical protein